MSPSASTNSRTDVEVVIQRRPRGERDPRGPECDAGRPDDLEGCEDIGACVPFLEVRQHRVAEGFDRGDHEHTAERRELGKDPPPLEDVLHLGGAVEAERGELLVHGADDRERVAGPVQEVRIATRDVARARADQTPDENPERLSSRWRVL
jgi:hypothetical protein